MSGGRGPRWGGIQEYRQASNDETMIAVMCESAQGLENIEEIAQVPGVDAVFVGAFDLSQALGVAGDTTNPKVETAIEQILDVCRRHEVIPGIVAPTIEVARKRIEQGFLYVTILDDMAFLAEAAQKRLSDVKG